MTETHVIDIAGNATEIETPDGFGLLAVDAVCWAFNYSETIDDGEGGETANPISREKFTALQGLQFFRQKAAEYNQQRKIDAAVALAEAENAGLGSQIVIK